MFTRIVTFTGAKDIDKGIEYVRDEVTPVLHSQRGWRGTTVTADRTAGVFSVLTLWETEADRDASESALGKVRDEGHTIIGGKLSVDYYEEISRELTKIPPVGSKLLLTKASMDPAKVEENITFFAREIAPQIVSAPGFLAYRQMINRKTGDSLLGTTWTNSESRRKALAMAEARQSTGKMPVTIRERSERDVVYIDLQK